MTFLPPLVLSLLFLFGFLVAIGYAGAVATLWTCIIRPLLAWKVRAARREDGGEGFAPGGLFMIVLVILFGVLTAAFHLPAQHGGACCLSIPADSCHTVVTAGALKASSACHTGNIGVGY